MRLTIDIKITLAAILFVIAAAAVILYGNHAMGAPLAEFWPPRPVLHVELQVR